MGDQQGVVDLQDAVAAGRGGAAELAVHVDAAVPEGQLGVIFHSGATDLAAQALALAGQADVGVLHREVGALASYVDAAQVAPARIQLHVPGGGVGELTGDGFVLADDFAVLDLQSCKGGLLLGHFAGTTGAAGALAVAHGRSLHFHIDRTGECLPGNAVNQFHNRCLLSFHCWNTTYYCITFACKLKLSDLAKIRGELLSVMAKIFMPSWLDRED